MSLTSFIAQKDVKAKLRSVFPSPRFELEERAVIEPLTNHYTLVGTAFDYLLRFSLQRLHAHAIEKPWIAELAAIQHFADLAGIYGEKRAQQAVSIVEEAKHHHIQYLQTGILTQEILRSALLLAQIDPFFRAGKLYEPFSVVDSRDCDDLEQLVTAIPFDHFLSQSVCLLDPTFGSSRLVKGADVDLVLDEVMIDIKTTKFLQLKREYLDQLLGYYVLYQLGGVTGMPEGHTINHLSIYFARHGYLYTFPIEHIASEATFLAFSSWFLSRAQQQYGKLGN